MVGFRFARKDKLARFFPFSCHLLSPIIMYLLAVLPQRSCADLRHRIIHFSISRECAILLYSKAGWNNR